MTAKAKQLVVGIDLGGTNMQVGVVDESNGILGRVADKTLAAEGEEAVINRVVANIDEACARAEVSRKDIAAVGIAAAGAIDIPNGVVVEAPNLEWYDLPLRDMLSERVGCTVMVENDVNAAVWAEQQLGAGAGFDDLLGVWVGTGVGGGLVFNGRIYHGPMFTAGEIGHTVILPEDGTGKRTVEDLCSRSGMSSLIDQRIGEFTKSTLHYRAELDDPPMITMAEIAEAMANNDPLVNRVVTRGMRLLGVAIANWVTMLGLQRVVIGGGVTEALGRSYLARIGASFSNNVFPERSKACRIVMTELKADAGLLGAALVARGIDGAE